MATSPPFEAHITIENTEPSAVSLLSKATGLSKQTVKQAMQKGAVWLTRQKHTQRLRRVSRKLKLHDEIHLYYDAEVLATTPPKAHLIADESDFSIWYKPGGMLSQGSKWGDHCTITRWAVQHLRPERSAFLVHRLDKAANGLIMIAHSKKAATALSALFQQRHITKTYQAIVHGFVPEQPACLTLDDDIGGKTAITHVKMLAYSKTRDCSHVSITIETGRKHQIRRHLSQAGFPILGDRHYGKSQDTALDLQLTAVSLAFTCPLTQKPRRYALTEQYCPKL